MSNAQYANLTNTNMVEVVSDDGQSIQVDPKLMEQMGMELHEQPDDASKFCVRSSTI